MPSVPANDFLAVQSAGFPSEMVGVDARVPALAFPGLAEFCTNAPDLGSGFLAEPVVSRRAFGWLLARKLDRLIRMRTPDGNCNLLLMAKGLDLILGSDRKAEFLVAVAADASLATDFRLSKSVPRSLWGVTPIISLIALAAADAAAGCESESVVDTTYHVTGNFDISLKALFEQTFADAPQFSIAMHWLVFIWALFTYDNFFYFNDHGIVLPAGGYGSDRFGINVEEMRLLRAAGKRFYTMAYGADYRTRQKTLAGGKFNFCMQCPEIGKFCVCDDAAGGRMFSIIGRYATAMLATGLSLHQIPGCRRLDYIVLDTRNIRPLAPVERGRRLRLLHAPNHPYFKGSDYLEASVRRLAAEGCPIELEFVSGVPQADVIERMRSVDVVVDQLIGGSIGLTALEAMALGKPVISYLRDPVFVVAGERCPIINANPDSIDDVLRELCRDPARLESIGRQSRDYVERYYSIAALAERLRTLYLETGGFPERVNKRIVRSAGAGSNQIEASAPELTGKFRYSQILSAFSQSAYLWVSSVATSRALARSRSTSPYWFFHWVARSALLRTPAWVRRLARKLIQGIRWARRVIRRSIGWVRRSIGWVRRMVGRVVWRSVGWMLFNLLLRTLAVVARLVTAVRLRFGHGATFWGVTPILTLPVLANCDRMLGFESRSLVFQTYHITQNFDYVLKRWEDRVVQRAPRLYPAFTWTVFAWMICRFDIVHVFCDRGVALPPGRMGVNEDELRLLRLAGKRIYTYTYGADVRTRVKTQQLGTYNFCMSCPEPGKFCVCDDALGEKNIRTVERYATRMLAMGDMLAYVPRALDLHFWPIDVRRIAPLDTARPPGRALRVAHAPNHPHFKGTAYLEEAVGRLQKEGVGIELVRIQGVSNEEVLKRFREVDLVAEQFIGGFHGYTALEAMALGKPVISYLRNERMMIDADTCPILNASPDTLYQVLRDCATGRYDLVRIGRESRRYVERFYSLEAVAARLGKLYLDSADLPAHARDRVRKRVAALEAAWPIAEAA